MSSNLEKDTLIVKKCMIEAFNEGYKYINITYDGSGDSGSIEDIYLSNNIPNSPWDPPTDYVPINPRYRNHIENWACDDALCNVADWYNNDGGFGIISIDVTNGTYIIDNNIRVMEVHNETYKDKV